MHAPLGERSAERAVIGGGGGGQRRGVAGGRGPLRPAQRARRSQRHRRLLAPGPRRRRPLNAGVYF